MTDKENPEDVLAKEYGITDEDMEQIEAFSAKRRFERSVDDLRRTSKR